MNNRVVYERLYNCPCFLREFVKRALKGMVLFSPPYYICRLVTDCHRTLITVPPLGAAVAAAYLTPDDPRAVIHTPRTMGSSYTKHALPHDHALFAPAPALVFAEVQLVSVCVRCGQRCTADNQHPC
jgi:hypothetical protein